MTAEKRFLERPVKPNRQRDYFGKGKSTIHKARGA